MHHHQSRHFVGPIHIYRPQRSWGKVMFLQVSVILLTGGCLAQCMLGYTAPTPPEQTPPPLGAEETPPWEQTPPGSRHPPEQTPPWEQTPPRADTPEQTPPQSRGDTPRAETPLEQTPPTGADSPLEQTPPGADPPGADTPLPEQSPPRRACWEIRSTRGRYASYWNAIL